MASCQIRVGLTPPPPTFHVSLLQLSPALLLLVLPTVLDNTYGPERTQPMLARYVA